MAKAAKKSKRKSLPKKPRPPTDTALINQCVIYAQSIAAHHAGFAADPDGNSAHAATLGNRHHDRATDALAKLTSMKATSAAGLQAKARIVPMILSEQFRGLERDERPFLVGFAADVKAFLAPLVSAGDA